MALRCYWCGAFVSPNGLSPNSVKARCEKCGTVREVWDPDSR